MNIINSYINDYLELHDLGFYYLPKISSNVPNTILATIYLYFFIKWFYKDKNILIKLYTLISILFIIRLVAFNITILPPTIEDCVSRKVKSEIIWFTFRFDSACSDNMFSGHAVHMTMLTLFTLEYSRNKFEKYMVKSLYIPYLLLIVAARLHYSIDVFIGSILSILMFYTYLYKIMSI